MNTESLIHALCMDKHRLPRLVPALGSGIVLGLLASALLFAVALTPRPDLASAAMQPRLALKFLVALTLAFAAMLWTLRLARPGARTAAAVAAVAVAPILLMIGVVAESWALPPEIWLSQMVGVHPAACFAWILLLSAPMLAGGILALRSGAPTKPATAGAATGLVAGGFATALYALHCPDDSPFFLAVWYTAAIVVMAGLGAMLGRRWLVW